jgi:hypothetical protein
MNHPVDQRSAKWNLGRTKESQARTAIEPREPSSLLSANVFLLKETLSPERETAAQPMHLPAE